ncbi:MAG: ComF family protein [bacterium]|nr:ComF family protein [Candidatus Aquidulcis sp.]
MQFTERARDALAEMQRVAAPVLALLAPQRCGACSSEGALLCTECGDALGLSGDCDVERGAAPLGCDAGAWIGPYEGGLGEMVRTLKFHSVPALAEPLGLGLVRAIRAVQQEIGGNATLVPIPTDPARLRDRGFDHAALIASAAARALHSALMPLLVRTRAVPALHTLGRAERRRVMDRVFAIRTGDTVPERVILIDDIWTSGATFEAAASALRAAGCTKIGVVAVAREALDTGA